MALKPTPRTAPPARDLAGRLDAAEGAGAVPAEKVNILVVDDLPEKLLVFGTVLEPLHQNLVFVESGRAALREVLQREFAVILLDVNMPELDGFDTAELIRNYQPSRHTPIIFITSYADEMQTARGYSLGAVDYILSPVIPEVLRSKVGVFVALHQMQAQVRRQADQRAAMIAAEAAQKTAERNQRRLAFLSHASRVLGQNLDLMHGAERLAALLVPEQAAGAVVAVADEEGTIGDCVEAAVLGHLDAVGPTPRKPAPPRLVRCADLPPAMYLALRDSVRLRRRVAFDAGEQGATEALAALPLIAGERVFGALLAVQPIEPNGPLLDDLADRAGAAFENAHLYGSLQAEIVERRAAEAALAESGRRKDEFLAMLSHELRNPLAAVATALEVTRRLGANDKPRGNRAVDVMVRQTRQMTRLVDELLDVARISENKIELGRERVDLNAVIAQGVETAQPAVDEREQKLLVSLPPEPLWLYGDPARLTQIVSNLLHNASKFSGRGTAIQLRASVDEQGALIVVRDQGVGIDPELLPRIFDLFAQGERGLDRSQGGLGVGLTLAMRLAQLHGGHIEAASEGKDRGAEFRVRLPCLWLAHSDKPAAPGRVDNTATPSRRVLVVDDNFDAAGSLATLLELSGHVVQTAADGQRALEAATEFEPEVVILDVGLPVLDGYEVARRLRRTNVGRRALLIALTGYGQPEDRAEAERAGFDVHFVKPADPDDLAACIALRGSPRPVRASG